MMSISNRIGYDIKLISSTKKIQHIQQGLQEGRLFQPPREGFERMSSKNKNKTKIRNTATISDPHL